MNISQFKELKVGDAVQIQGNTKTRNCYATVIETYLDMFPNGSMVKVEIVPGEVRKYVYKNLRLVEDIEKE